MSDKEMPKDRKRRRNGHVVHELDEVNDFADIKKLKISTVDDDLRMHETRSPVSIDSFSSPHSPEPIPCDSVMPAPVPQEEGEEFLGYERFNHFLGQIHLESKFHHTHLPAPESSMGDSPYRQ